MKSGTRGLPYGDKVDRDIRCKLTEQQHNYVRARSKLDNKHIQDVVRDLIDKAYEKELSNGLDVIAVAKENYLI